MKKAFEDKIKAQDSKLLESDTEVTNLAGIKDKWHKFEQEKQDLIRERDEEKKMRGQEVDEKERQKIQATESLRKEMLYKIKETKANLLALNDEQLQTTTRLTILQNH